MRWMAIGLLELGVAVVAGAFAAHGLEGRVDGEALEWWRTGSLYLALSGLGCAVVGSRLDRLGRSGRFASLLLAAGGALFFLTLTVMALGGPRWLGAVTPLGGLGMVVGCGAAGLAAWRAGDRPLA